MMFLPEGSATRKARTRRRAPSFQPTIPLLLALTSGWFHSCRDERPIAPTSRENASPSGKSARARETQTHTAFTSLTHGTPTRLVWIKDPSEKVSDTFAEKNSLLLMAWDSREERPRQLASHPGNFGRPLITPDGETVVFTDKRLQRRGQTRHLRPLIRAVPWQGGRPRGLSPGFAVDTWADPKTGRLWIYALDTVHDSTLPSVTGSTLIRFPLDDPRQRETVWTRTRLSLDSVQVSRDGQRFAALFPWPDAGVADITTGHWTKLDVGCWPALAPDNSYLAWLFDGAHRNLLMVAPENNRRWKINISEGPLLRGKETYHPRWSNHPQFIAFTGPYTKKKKGARNAISTGGLSAEIHIGRLSTDLSHLESSAQLTRNKNGDFYPDLWISGADTVTIAGMTQQPAATSPAPTAWPPSPENMVFVWQNLRAGNEIPDNNDRPACRLEAHGVARFTQHLGALLDGGWFEADPSSNAAIAEAVRAGRGLTLQALHTDASAATSTPEKLSPTLLSWQTSQGTSTLSLQREPAALHLSIGSGPSQAEATIPFVPDPDSPTAIALVWQPPHLRVALNGKWAGPPLVIPSAIATQWPEGKLTVGQPPNASIAPNTRPAPDRPKASLERITIHDRPLDIADIRRRADQDLAESKGRTTPPRLRLRARVLETTQPDPEALDTYHRMLVDHTYEVTAVLEGALEAKKIAVLHWGVLDRQLVPGVPQPVGSEVELTLEPHADHPELQGELTDLTSDEFGLPLFLDVTTPHTPGPPTQ